MGFLDEQEMGRPITVKDEGLSIASNVGSIDFAGAGISGAAIGTDVTETVPGGGGGYTQGSVPFAAANGILTQDNANFFWNAASKYLTLGGNNGTARFHIRGTTLNDVGRFDIGIDFIRVAEPPAPGVALINAPGNINPGGHFYFVTYTTAVGETEVSVQSYAAPYIVTDVNNAQVTVTLPISSDYRVTGRKVYRAVTGPTWWNNVRCVGTINNNTDVTFIDNVSDANRTGPNEAAVRDNTTNALLMVGGVTSVRVTPKNTFLGYLAGTNIQTGVGSAGGNTFLGMAAGAYVTSGNKNVAVGEGALLNAGGSDSNIAIGHYAAANAGYAQGSIFMGRNCAGWHTSGYGNIFIGNTTASGGVYYSSNYNTVLGNGALALVKTNSNNHCIFGTQTGYNITTAAGCIIIGAFVNAADATTNGQLNIGNVIFGTGMYNSAVNSNTPTTTGKLGICVATPTARWHLPAGAAGAGMAPVKMTPGTNLAAPEDGVFEYDGATLYFTVGAVRKTVTLV